MFNFGYIIDLFSKKSQIEDETPVSPLEIKEPEVDIVDPNKNNFSLFMDDFQKSVSMKDLLQMYRDAAENPEIENAIDEICNEAIICEKNSIMKTDLDNTEFSANIQKKIIEEFENVLNILDFNKKGYNLFKQWFTEGRLYIYLKLDEKNLQGGIVGFDILIPEKITKVKNKKTGELVYYYENEEGDVYKIDQDLIVFIHSGITDPNKSYYVSYLHKSLKPLNQLRLLEDSAIIYRITRAPERRVFYIDVGKLSKVKAESYIQKMINKFRNKISYDISTGKVTNQKNTMTILEDFYFPVTEGGRGTKVETLESGQTLTDMSDILYFKKKLYKSLKIPLSRFADEENSPLIGGIGNAAETTREELKFHKFIIRLQSQFQILIFDLLKRNLIWKNIIEKNEWEENKQEIQIIWNTDSYFAELKKQELLRTKLELMDGMTEYIGKYFSNSYIKKQILNFSDDEIEVMQKEIEEEMKAGEIEEPEEKEE